MVEKVAVMVCVLASAGVMVTWQLDLSVVAGTAAKVQGLVITSVPTLELTVTVVPTPGLDLVPLASVSVTVTVAVVLCPTTIGLALKATAVEVERLFTVRSALPLLP